jgi:phenylalanyl-tRNA synthetase beta chain
MRTSVLDTLLDILRRNVARGARDLALYEIGLVTVGRPDQPPVPIPGVEGRPADDVLASILDGVPVQPRHLALAAAGDAVPTGPWGDARRVEASDAVAWAVELGRALGLELLVRNHSRAPFHPGRCAVITLADGRVVGHAGELHPKVVGALGLPARTVAAELDVDVLVEATGTPVQARPLSTYPVAHTDLAVVVDDGVPAADVAAALGGGAGPQLESLTLFDLYRGDQVGEGRKSLAYRLTFRAEDRTLTTDEVSALRDSAMRAAAEAVGAVQRA